MSAAPDRLRQLASELRALRSEAPTPERVERAFSSLSCRHEGIASLAARCLGAWARPEFVAPLRARLLPLLDSGARGAFRRVLVAALMACAGSEDADWVAPLLFEQPFAPGSSDLAPLLRALPWPRWIERVTAECAHPLAPRRRLAATVLGFSAVPADRLRPLLAPLLADPDADVAALARFQMARLSPPPAG